MSHVGMPGWANSFIALDDRNLSGVGRLLRDDAWTDNNVIDPDVLIGQLAFGLDYERPTWVLRFNPVLGTDTVDVPNDRE